MFYGTALLLNEVEIIKSLFFIKTIAIPTAALTIPIHAATIITMMTICVRDNVIFVFVTKLNLNFSHMLITITIKKKGFYGLCWVSRFLCRLWWRLLWPFVYEIDVCEWPQFINRLATWSEIDIWARSPGIRHNSCRIRTMDRSTRMSTIFHNSLLAKTLVCLLTL